VPRTVCEALGDGQQFDAVMNAIISNGEAVDGVEAAAVSLLLQRLDDDA